MRGGFAFDVQAVCAGFVYALANANALILSGQADRVVVIGAETFSRIMDWTDRGTCVLFGDGAGAVILEAQEGAGGPGRSRHPRHRPQFRRSLPRSALCGWRRFLQRDVGCPEDAGAGGFPPCR
jgi:3-oxoacyl-(acyl-carrier-protein) synthase